MATEEKKELNESNKTAANGSGTDLSLQITQDDNQNPLNEKLLPQQTTINAGQRISNQPHSLTQNLLFFDPSQLQQSPKPSDIILGIEEQSILQLSHGKCATTNFVMDFQTNIGVNTTGIIPPNINCRIVNGIKSGKLSVVQRKEIKNMIFKIWSDILEKNKPEPGCCPDCKCDPTSIKYEYALIPSILAIAILLLIYYIDGTTPIWWILSMVGLGLIFVICFIAWCEKTNKKSGNTVKSSDPEQVEFRTEFIQRMIEYMDNDLKKQYPDLLFTLIYPIKMSDGKDLWFYLRVTQGIIDLDDFEPLLYRTCDENDVEFEEDNEHCKLEVSIQGYGGGDSAKDKVDKVMGNASAAMDATASAISLLQNFKK